MALRVMRFPWRVRERLAPYSGRPRLRVKLNLRLRQLESLLARPLSTFLPNGEVSSSSSPSPSGPPALANTATRTARYTHNDLGQLIRHPRHLIKDLSLLHPADLIAFPRKLLSDTHWMGYWHVAIVESTDIANQLINVIHYQPVFDDTYGATVDKTPSTQKGFNKAKGSVCRSALPFADDQVWLVELKVEDCLTAEEVLERARSRLGENKYDLLWNNCESFAFSCKTGECSSAQANTAAKVALHHTTRAVSKVVIRRAAEAAINKAVIKNVISQAPSVGVRSALRMGKVFAAVDLAIGTGLAVKDVMKAKQRLKEGQLDETEYNSAVKTRVAVATGDISCAVIGTMAGSAVGGPVGAVIGGTIGSGIGTVIGSATAKQLTSPDGDQPKEDKRPTARQ